MEGCSETEIIKFEKVGCLQALFGLGAASGPRDFKSRVSTYSTTAAFSVYVVINLDILYTYFYWLSSLFLKFSEIIFSFFVLYFVPK